MRPVRRAVDGSTSRVDLNTSPDPVIAKLRSPRSLGGSAVALQSVSQVVAHRGPFDVEDRIYDGVAARTVGEHLVAAQHAVEFRAQPFDGRAAGEVKKVRPEFDCDTA